MLFPSELKVGHEKEGFTKCTWIPQPSGDEYKFNCINKKVESIIIQNSAKEDLIFKEIPEYICGKDEKTEKETCYRARLDGAPEFLFKLGPSGFNPVGYFGLITKENDPKYVVFMTPDTKMDDDVVSMARTPCVVRKREGSKIEKEALWCHVRGGWHYCNSKLSCSLALLFSFFSLLFRI